MQTFVFIKKDDPVEIQILEGSCIENIKSRNNDLENFTHSYEWNEFCNNVNLNQKKNIVDPSLNFEGKHIKIVYVEDVVNKEFAKGYRVIINGKITPLFIFKQDDFTLDLRFIFAYINNIFNGYEK